MSKWYALDSTRVSVMVHIIVAAFTSSQYTSVTAMDSTAIHGGALGWWMERFAKFGWDCCEMLGFRVCCGSQNFCVFNFYSNPHLDDRIYDWLLTLMAAMPAEDVRASFLCVGAWFVWPSSRLAGFNAHESSWCCCCWLRNCIRLLLAQPMHVPVDILMTDVLDLVRVAVV